MAISIIFNIAIFSSCICGIKFISAQFYNSAPIAPLYYRNNHQQYYNPLSRGASSYFQTYSSSNLGSPFSDARNIQRPPEIFQGFVRNGITSPTLRRKDVVNLKNDHHEEVSQGRLLSASAFSKISETLGALNTVGQYIVDMTRGSDSDESEEDSVQGSVPDAILTLTKNVLGQNMTRTIEPLIKRVGKDEEKVRPNTTLDQKKKKNKHNKVKKDTRIHNLTTTPSTTTLTPLLEAALYDDSDSKEGENRCTTPEGRPGRCEDLSSCPSLLLDLGSLRESLCFKSLFVPGVCCPISQSTIMTTRRPPIRLTAKPPVFRPTTSRPTSPSLILIPQITASTTTQKPFASVFGPSSNDLPSVPLNVVDPEDCGQQEYSSGRIVGGIQSENGEWPWLAAIFLHGPKRTEFWCGGSLIGTKYVLTAAHCTRDSRQKPFAARQFTVRLGDVDLSTDGEPSAPQTFQVKEVRAHERFSRVGFYNDVAVLVLDKPARKSRFVIPVCLPKPGNIPQGRDRLAGRRATVVGWGTTYYGGKESTVQRQAELPIWKNDDCDRAYFQPITDNFLCAGYTEGGVDACQGDSGGPLMMKFDTRWIQVGIVSFGNKCGEPGYPGVYTRISEYISWIREHTKD